MWEKYKIYAKRSEAENFFEKIYNKGPKMHCFALKLYTGASKPRGQGGARAPRSPPLDPLVEVFTLTSGMGMGQGTGHIDSCSMYLSWDPENVYIINAN